MNFGVPTITHSDEIVKVADKDQIDGGEAHSCINFYL